MKKIIWHFADYEIKTDYHFLNSYLTFGRHFTGIKFTVIEFWFEGGCIGFSNFFKKWVVGNDFSDKISKRGKLRSITIRLGKPIIHIHLSKSSRNKALESVKRYQIN